MRKLFLILAFVTNSACASLSVLVYDTASGQPIVSENADVVRPVASITKLMTAIVSLETYSLDTVVKLSKRTTTTVKELLTNLLVKSDNHAAEILAKNHPEGRLGFMMAMNSKSRQLGLNNTHFDDPSGLISTNTSTANELATLVQTAGQYDFIRHASSQVEQNTNKPILERFRNVIVSKTGFTSKAGRCVVMLVDKSGTNHAIIILGEPTRQARDDLAKNLLLTVSSIK